MNRALSMKEHLIGQFSEKPNLCAVLDVLGTELDEVQGAGSILERANSLTESVRLSGSHGRYTTPYRLPFSGLKTKTMRLVLMKVGSVTVGKYG